jgi:hypothetical protein
LRALISFLSARSSFLRRALLALLERVDLVQSAAGAQP